MFKQFYDDFIHLPYTKFGAKYTIPFFICLLICVLIGQLLSMLIPLNQLNKADGRIVTMETKATSRSRNDSPNYSLVVTFDNGRSFDIEDQDTRAKLGSILKKGDYITIYYPTLTLKVLSADFVRDVSQVERGNTVLYSWMEQQHEVWYIVGFLVVAIGLFYGFILYLRAYKDR